MKMVPITEAQDSLTALVREVEAGERVVLTKNGIPVADLVMHERKRGFDMEALRRYKEERGLPQIFAEIPPDFDDPLPEDFLITPER